MRKPLPTVKLHQTAERVHHGRQVPQVEADIDAGNLESAVYNLLLNACRGRDAFSSPEVKVHVTETDKQVYINISGQRSRHTGLRPEDVVRSVRHRRKTERDRLGLLLPSNRWGARKCHFEESNRERTVFTLSLPKNRLADSISKLCTPSDHGSAMVGRTS